MLAYVRTQVWQEAQTHDQGVWPEAQTPLRLLRTYTRLARHTDSRARGLAKGTDSPS